MSNSGLSKLEEQAAEYAATEVAYLSEEIKLNGWTPIETLFFTAIDWFYQQRRCQLYIRRNSSLEVANEFLKDDSWEGQAVFPQCQIDDWRVDFLFCIRPDVRLIVECDGHDFHERTKEQAAKDRARDRKVQAKGFTIFRFTGSELYRDPLGCAEQVYDWFSGKGEDA